jgi:hypothetical protein
MRLSHVQEASPAIDHAIENPTQAVSATSDPTASLEARSSDATGRRVSATQHAASHVAAIAGRPTRSATGPVASLAKTARAQRPRRTPASATSLRLSAPARVTLVTADHPGATRPTRRRARSEIQGRRRRPSPANGIRADDAGPRRALEAVLDLVEDEAGTSGEASKMSRTDPHASQIVYPSLILLRWHPGTLPVGRLASPVS